MSDQFGFIEGAKSVTSSMDASREASKSITKSITDVQKDAAAVAQQKDLERKRQIRETQVFKEQYFKRALMEWQKFALIHTHKVKPDGRWAHSELGLIMARQQGKSTLMMLRILTGMFVWGDNLQLSSAHRLTTSAIVTT